VKLIIQVDTDKSATRDLRKFMRCATGMLELEEVQQHHLITALTEFCNNVVRHAKPAATTIKVQLTPRHGEWEIDVADDGGEFDPLQSDKFEPLRTGNSALRTSGMGIALIATCFPDCDYVGKSRAPDKLNHFRIPLHLPI
jgi:anti-sigma regulatory factor (Ser/Thr protein kinase)